MERINELAKEVTKATEELQAEAKKVEGGEGGGGQGIKPKNPEATPETEGM